MNLENKIKLLNRISDLLEEEGVHFRIYRGSGIANRYTIYKGTEEICDTNLNFDGTINSGTIKDYSDKLSRSLELKKKSDLETLKDLAERYPFELQDIIAKGED